MKPLRSPLALTALCALALIAGSACADTPVRKPRPGETLPAWYHYVWDIPIIKGEYIPINGGTLGGLGVTFTDTTPHVFGVSTFYYDVAGNPVTDATGGLVTINDHATLRSTGVVAWTDMSYYRLSNGPCRGCADHPRDQVQTSDVGKFEWTGPRSGRYTVNGQSQEMVEAVSGPPLVAPTDFSGRWLMVMRRDSAPISNSAQPAIHAENVAFVDLTAVTGERTYSSTPLTIPTYPPIGEIPLPPAGARLYDITCAVAATQGVPAPCRLDELGAISVLGEFTVWFDDRNVGRVMVAKNTNGVRNLYDFGQEAARAYGVADRIVIRMVGVPSFDATDYILKEFVLIRASSEVSQGGTWAPKPR